MKQLHYFVAAMKREGIYSTLSFYFPLWMKVRDSYGLDGYDQGKGSHPFALIFFNPKLQRAYRNWLTEMLGAVNPHTGLPLAREPALAMIELVNEDSTLFWTFNNVNVPTPQMKILELRFGRWLKERYGSLQNALARWRGFGEKRDDLGAGRIQILDVWNITRQGLKPWGAGKDARMADQARFQMQLQRDFYASIRDFIRGDLRSPQLLVAGNWTTADNPLLLPLEHWSYGACDVMDRHGYFNCEHKGYRASWLVHDDQIFHDRAGVLEPEELPIRCIQVAGRPQIISEIGWPLPNRLRAEAPLVCSAYGGLQGIDGVFFFALTRAGWDAGTPKFAVSTPSVLGQFFANALQYRRSDIATAPPAQSMTIDLERLLKFDQWKKFEDVSPPVEERAFFAGPVVRVFGDEAKLKNHPRLPQVMNGGRIEALTGEAVWDADSGLVAVNSVRSQAAAGFLRRAGAIELGDVVIECGNEYGAIHVISLDDKPLRSSQKILIQAFTREQTYEFQTDEEGRIINIGRPPLNIENIECRVILKKRGEEKMQRVVALDPNGYAEAKAVATESVADGATAVVLPSDSLYTIIEY